jgi:hypothetical protein
MLTCRGAARLRSARRGVHQNVLAPLTDASKANRRAWAGNAPHCPEDHDETGLYRVMPSALRPDLDSGLMSNTIPGSAEKYSVSERNRVRVGPESPQVCRVSSRCPVIGPRFRGD